MGNTCPPPSILTTRTPYASRPKCTSVLKVVPSQTGGRREGNTESAKQKILLTHVQLVNIGSPTLQTTETAFTSTDNKKWLMSARTSGSHCRSHKTFLLNLQFTNY